MIASSVRAPAGLPPKVGIGLKPRHYAELLDDLDGGSCPVAWVEVHPQNYFGPDGTVGGGAQHRWLGAIAECLPLSLHSVGLSLGSAEGLDRAELDALAGMADRYRPAAISDHLSWSGSRADKLPDLLPVPYTKEALDHFTRQVEVAQERLGRPILIENPSRMFGWADDEMEEIAFVAALIARTGCGLLLDIANVVVSTTNLGGSAEAWLDAVDPEWVGEIHLAGYRIEDHDSGPLAIDDHGGPVGERVWALFEHFVTRAGPTPTLIEWDRDVPPYGRLVEEARKAQRILDRVATARSRVTAHAG